MDHILLTKRDNIGKQFQLGLHTKFIRRTFNTLIHKRFWLMLANFSLAVHKE